MRIILDTIGMLCALSLPWIGEALFVVIQAIVTG